MDTIQVFVLAIIQGLTEFWPISSSGHLILMPRFAGWEDQGLAFDVAVHVGTLIAVLGYFRKEVCLMSVAWLRSIRGAASTPESRLAWAVLWGTVPAGLAGLFFSDYIESNFRSPMLVAGTLTVYGLLLLLADRFRRSTRDEYSLRWSDVLVVGCAQALSLIPGTSRSGVTMTAALFLGFTRHGAARFSFLLSIPVMVLAGVLESTHLVQGSEPVNWAVLGMGAVIAGFTGFVCIHVFLGLLEKIGMAPFVIYRLILAAVIVFMFI